MAKAVALMVCVCICVCVCQRVCVGVPQKLHDLLCQRWVARCRILEAVCCIREAIVVIVHRRGCTGGHSRLVCLPVSGHAHDGAGPARHRTSMGRTGKRSAIAVAKGLAACVYPAEPDSHTMALGLRARGSQRLHRSAVALCTRVRTSQ